MIKQLETLNIGPSNQLDIKFDEQLNLLEGENNHGKSLILNTLWWSLTHSWPSKVNPKITNGNIILPKNKKQKALIKSTFVDSNNVSSFESRTQSWSIDKNNNLDLVFYAMSSGNFAIWDPIRNIKAYVFSQKEILDGLCIDDKWLCNGLIRDWADWQKGKSKSFGLFCDILELLSCSDNKLIPGELTRISLDDIRDMPTLMPNDAIVHVSDGIKRIIYLSYFIVWTIKEHAKVKKLFGDDSERKAIFLIDDIELYLCPKWQSTIVQSLLNLVDKLPMVNIQFIITTSSSFVTTNYKTIEV